jgi:DNA modification methylase
MNQIILGDNLEVMRGMEAETVDLCYIDPPFFTQKDWGSFSDVHKSLDHYLEFLELRVSEIHRLLKPTGSFYLHLDYHAVHYAKVILDEIFGYKNFKNEIIWKKKPGSNSTGIPRKLPSNTDTILFYSKGNEYTFNAQYNEYTSEYLEKTYKFDDNDGRGLYLKCPMGSPSYSPTLIYDYKGYKPPEKGWRVNLIKMKKLDSEGRLYFPKEKTGRITRKLYLNEMKGAPLENIWTDIGMLKAKSSDKTGYPTQKPVPLLERIIKMSSNEGDLVFDCFAGSGTTLKAAQNLNRNYIGIDSNPDAVAIAEKRLEKTP